MNNPHDRIPSGPAWPPLLLALGLALLVLTGLELFWRKQGFRPSGTDDKDSWCGAREQVSDAEGQTLLLLGASRIQVGFVPRVWREMCPEYGVIQCAYAGKTPMATLHDIAHNEDFAGLVICSSLAQFLLAECWEDQADLARYYREEWSLLRSYSRRVRQILQDNLVVILPQLQLHRSLPALVQGGIQGQYILIHGDRSWEMHFDLVPNLEQVAGFLNSRFQQIYQGNRTDLSAAEWVEACMRAEKLVQRIQGRGGRVVFLRFPTSGSIRKLEERIFPRARFWDVFAGLTSATTIHGDDLPGMKGVACPDGSHLDYADAIKMTRQVVGELGRRKIL